MVPSPALVAMRLPSGELRLAPGHWSAFCRRKGRWQEFELATRRVRRELAIDGSLETVSPDGRFFLTAHEGYYHLFEQLSAQPQRILAWIDAHHPYYNPGARVRFSPKSRLVAGIAGADVVRVWDRDTGTVLATLAGHHGGAVAVAFAPRLKSPLSVSTANVLFLLPSMTLHQCMAPS